MREQGLPGGGEGDRQARPPALSGRRPQQLGSGCIGVQRGWARLFCLLPIIPYQPREVWPCPYPPCLASSPPGTAIKACWWTVASHLPHQSLQRRLYRTVLSYHAAMQRPPIRAGAVLCAFLHFAVSICGAAAYAPETPDAPDRPLDSLSTCSSPPKRPTERWAVAGNAVRSGRCLCSRGRGTARVGTVPRTRATAADTAGTTPRSIRTLMSRRAVHGNRLFVLYRGPRCFRNQPIVRVVASVCSGNVMSPWTPCG